MLYFYKYLYTLTWFGNKHLLENCFWWITVLLLAVKIVVFNMWVLNNWKLFVWDALEACWYKHIFLFDSDNRTYKLLEKHQSFVLRIQYPQSIIHLDVDCLLIEKWEEFTCLRMKLVEVVLPSERLRRLRLEYVPLLTCEGSEEHLSMIEQLNFISRSTKNEQKRMN